jgi:hypothetical protein
LEAKLPHAQRRDGLAAGHLRGLQLAKFCKKASSRIQSATARLGGDGGTGDMTKRVSKFADILPALLAVGMVGCGQQQVSADNLNASRAQTAQLIAQAEGIINSCRDIKIRGTVTMLLNMAKSDLASQQDGPAADLTFKASTLTKNCIELMLQLQKHEQTCKAPARIGMTAEQLKGTIWCEPSHVNRTITEGHVNEQWIYDSNDVGPIEGFSPPRGYLYLTDGVLTAIQER